MGILFLSGFLNLPTLVQGHPASNGGVQFKSQLASALPGSALRPWRPVEEADGFETIL